MRRPVLVAVALSTLSALGPVGALAQPWPSRPVRVVIGFAPGGGTDIVGRLLAQKLSDAFGQPFVAENRPGATGMLAARQVATAPADGYTLLMGHVNSNAIAPSLSDKPPYDPVADFAPVAYVGYVPNVLVINSALPVKSVAELVALAKSRPGGQGLTFGSPGVGSTNHLAGEMLRLDAGVPLVHVPYKGSSPAIVDLLGGQLDMNFDAMSSITSYLKAGRMRPLAVTTPQRDPDLPDVPTMLELGYRSMSVTNWYGVFAPAGTPPAVVNRLNGEVLRILSLPDVGAKLSELGVRRNPMSPQAFGAFVADEVAKYRAVSKASGVRID